MSDTMSAQTQPSSAGGDIPSQLPDSALVTEQGKTTIADAVVAKIAGIATRDSAHPVRTPNGCVRWWPESATGAQSCCSSQTHSPR